MFPSFIEKLKIRLAQPLPGETVQFLMAPATRQQIRDIDPDTYHPKKSAVLILLFPVNNAINILLIQRAEYDGVHSGQVAFPGGKYEEQDVDLKQTAIRETFEEVGVPLNDIEIIGKLSDIYINPSNYLVTPFIGYSYKMPNFIIDEYEVQQTICIDLFQLNNNSVRAKKMITLANGTKINTPCYEIEGLTIWGATAMMISELNVVVEEAKRIK
jgi:8-oxo-dGTP pyrophosphatase MutT (NUDIX family)